MYDIKNIESTEGILVLTRTYDCSFFHSYERSNVNLKWRRMSPEVVHDDKCEALGGPHQ